jgi:protein-tyrosine phosphatase
VASDDGGWYGIAGFAVRPTRPRLSRILPRLLVGEYPNLDDVAWLRRTHRVTAVLSLQDDADLASKRLRLADLEAAYGRDGVAFHHIPIPDGDVDHLAAHLPRIVGTLHELIAGGARVYLHCNGGLNRAPTAAIAYVHLRYLVPLARAAAFVRRRRQCAPYVRALEHCYGPLTPRRTPPRRPRGGA